MKATTLTKSNRPQTRTIVSSEFTIKSSRPYELIISVPYQDSAKDLIITFSGQELRTMLDEIETHNSFLEALKPTPNDSGALV